MASIQLNEIAREQITAHNLDLNQIENQLLVFKRGIPYVQLDRPCIPGDGIALLDPSDFENYQSLHSQAALAGRFSKFVPASGAATRMFKDLSRFLKNYPDISTFEELENNLENGDETLVFVHHFLIHLKQFAFYNLLANSFSSQSLNIEDVLTSGDIKQIICHLLDKDYLAYQNKPKGLIPFHIRKGELLTPFAEHLLEAYSYMKSEKGQCRIHFTIAPKHLGEVRDHIRILTEKYAEIGVHFQIDFSEQKSSTDTIAVFTDNTPYVDEAGRLLLRPAGHGALLQNLNEMKGDIVYIKNIDNIVPEDKREDTYKYKILLGGLLLELQTTVFDTLRRLDDGVVDFEATESIKNWTINNLNSSFPEEWESFGLDQRKSFLYTLLHRPLRVCGMVKNLGQPGGGPFWVKGPNGTCSPQIIESSQIDHKDSEQENIAQSATHFNPVDLVCGVRDYKGKSFDLNNFVDDSMGFISEKTFKGKKIKALELPGLWNGAMAHWNTVFVDVPISTFSPVKNVNDLLSEDHI